ncbi:MAG: HK97-gp10 family putative phage morphogenesis protein [Rhodospirillaceae bacterium]
MVPVSFELVGFDELQKLLRALPKAMSDKAQLDALRGAGKLLKAELARTAPRRNVPGFKEVKRGKTRGPGYLRRNIIIAKKRAKGDRSVLAVSVGPARSAFYGMFAEFGTATQPARPWVRPAIDRVHAQVIAAIGQEMGKTVEREAKKLGRSMPRAQRRRAFRFG